MKWKERENALLVLNRKKVLSYLIRPVDTGHQWESKISSLDIFLEIIYLIV